MGSDPDRAFVRRLRGQSHTRAAAGVAAALEAWARYALEWRGRALDFERVEATISGSDEIVATLRRTYMPPESLAREARDRELEGIEARVTLVRKATRYLFGDRSEVTASLGSSTERARLSRR